MTTDACQVVLLTPEGRGAVATVLVEGAGAASITGELFRSLGGKPLDRFAPDQIVVGRWRGPQRSAGEEVVVCRRGQQRIEIHCHGGDAAAARVVEQLIQVGCRQVSWQSWVHRQESDPLAAAARIALAGARTERAATVLLDQYGGALRREIETIIAALNSGKADVAIERLGALDRLSELGRHLVAPWRIVLTGRSNVGKSSLINAMVGFRRAIVHNTPGTTRDVVHAATALSGWPVEFCDTAGVRNTADSVERAGVIRTHRQWAAADLIVAVFDVSEPWCAADAALLHSLSGALIVHNKCDLAAVPNEDRPLGLATSAVTGEGIDRLLDAVTEQTVPDPPPPGAAVPFTAEQIEAVRDALAAATAEGQSTAAAILRQVAPLR